MVQTYRRRSGRKNLIERSNPESENHTPNSPTGQTVNPSDRIEKILNMSNFLID